VLESADRADSNSAVREDVWVRLPPAAPIGIDVGLTCRASPPDPVGCIDEIGLSSAYAYLLGLYLGDGMLTRAPRNVWRLRLSLDLKYPGIIAMAETAISDVAARHAGRVGRQGCVEIYSDWKHWICAFPQHGAGPKHERPISLHAWQSRIVTLHPGKFLAGLIHSDGCRVMNRVSGYV
jgi:hypothetical protein